MAPTRGFKKGFAVNWRRISVRYAVSTKRGTGQKNAVEGADGALGDVELIVTEILAV